MKKILLILGLSIVCVGAQADDWQTVGQSELASLALDRDSIKETQGIREVWSMWNFKEPRKNEGDATFPAFKSYKNLTQYNCKDRTMRLMKEMLFVDNNATGDMRDNSYVLKDSKFVAVPKDALAEKLMDNFVCNEKLDGDSPSEVATKEK